jgi:hypothetical protein
LIPVFGVCVTGALSIMTLDILLRKRSVARHNAAVSNSFPSAATEVRTNG